MTDYAAKLRDSLPPGYAELNSNEDVTMSDLDLTVDISTIMRIVKELQLETDNKVELSALMFVASNIWLGQVNMAVALEKSK